jgi:hypothetical protein
MHARARSTKNAGSAGVELIATQEEIVVVYPVPVAQARSGLE